MVWQGAPAFATSWTVAGSCDEPNWVCTTPILANVFQVIHVHSRVRNSISNHQGLPLYVKMQRWSDVCVKRGRVSDIWGFSRRSVTLTVFSSRSGTYLGICFCARDNETPRRRHEHPLSIWSSLHPAGKKPASAPANAFNDGFWGERASNVRRQRRDQLWAHFYITPLIEF
jgi:hypothetical protein